MAYISKKLVTDYFFQIFVMGTSCVALSIKNIKTGASREMTSRKKWGERCQALECGRARYLPSLIALLQLWIWLNHSNGYFKRSERSNLAPFLLGGNFLKNCSITFSLFMQDVSQGEY